MRGYRRLQAENQLSRIVELKDALTNTRFTVEAEFASAQIFGAGQKDAEIIIRQYLLARVGGLNLNKALLNSLGGGGAVVHPLPPRWRQTVRDHGFTVGGFRSALWWNAYVLIFAVYGMLLIISRGLAGLWKNTKDNGVLGRYAYFNSLVPGNLPRLDRHGRSYDILSWYLQWAERATNLATLAHGVKSVPDGMIQGLRIARLQYPIPLLFGGARVIRFLLWGLVASGHAALDLLGGRWWHALMLAEAAKAAQVRLCDPACLARDYLFHNSGWIYRPLWTYEAETSGSRILFYFYSTNTESFKTALGYPTQSNSWQAMNWPHYLVWDEYQAEFVRRAKGKQALVQVVGSIWFYASAAEISVLPPRTIAVFDIQPAREAFYCTLGLQLDYYTPETAIRFLGDIHDSVRSCGGMLALKRKRKVGRLAHPTYRKFVENLEKLPNFIAVDPDISAQSVIKESAIVISMPFTSTAIIARELGKPSCYYDPTGLVQQDDQAAHGIDIIRGREELEHWLTSAAKDAGQTPPGAGCKPR